MNLPLRLVKRETLGSADAAVVFTDDPAALVGVCAKLPAFPTVFRVAGGFLLFASVSAWPAGVVKLRRLGGDLFVPTDAELLPRLLPDEMVGLTETVGLVVLVTGALAFDPMKPLYPAEWLRPARLRRESWQPLPAPPDRAERLTTIERPTPPGLAVEILNEGKPDDASPLPERDEVPGDGGRVPDDARPPSGSFLDRVRAGAALRVGQFLAWAGKQLNAPGLGKLGGKVARKAVERVPRLTEKILGAQEAALRQVLRQLQSGDVEAALRRAPIAVGDPSRPTSVGTGTQLGTRDPRFSLAALLGSGGGGGSWLGGGDVWAHLAAEYRRLAEEAARRGDARRAAYLYGVLLRDVRAAANALMAGGYFREAAVLFRDKLSDLSAAATAFERAGDYDEAARLYERREEYEPAAEMYRRGGDEDRATVFFERAADRHKAGGRWLAAGDLLRKKLGRRQPATECYRRGWRTGGTDARACGERCVDDFLVAESWAEFDELIDEAAEAFPPPRSPEASAFFNYALHVGDDFLPPAHFGDVRDRVRLAFAEHLRADATVRQAGETARELFAPKGGWTGPQLRDAEYAARAAARVTESPARVSGSPPAGTVTAVAMARLSRDVLVAVDDEIFLWNNATSDRTRVTSVVGGRVTGLAISPDAAVVYALSEQADGVTLRCFTRATERFRHREAAYLPQGQWRSPTSDHHWSLLPQVEFRAGEPVVLVTHASERVELCGYFLRATTRAEGYVLDVTPRADRPYLTGSAPYLFERVTPDEYWEWDEVFCRRVAGPNTTRWVTNVTPAVPAGAALGRPPLDCLTPEAGCLQVVCVTGDGGVVWQEFTTDGTGHPRTTPARPEVPVPVVAACLCGPRRVAAATAAGTVHWFRVAGARLVSDARPTALGLPDRVAFLASGSTASEVYAVSAAGRVLRLSGP
ncbi:hypothetical protein [Limnoglobus roseus]|uniref:MoxR-vWA-beta-propeller ternary system domain-containing protein n=1 Tax=Limnoglobus roseus TaxID=2598579 RepID=A0A5C1ANP6_9BACT|nr:hypothetical protein [Limnoglobus roseus]QEL19626.1 hypothetical protein PX52LOC_06702 [Limnoglobus roseus]